MDRNTVIGLVLIGVILSIFTIVNQPSEEELKAEAAKSKKEQIDKKTKKESEKETIVADEVDTPELSADWSVKLDGKGNRVTAESGMVVYTNAITSQDTLIKEVVEPAKVKGAVNKSVKGESVTIQNAKLLISLNTVGGQIESVKLKGYESYKDFAKNDNKVEALELFKAGDAKNGIIIPIKGEEINTTEKLFTIKSKTDNSVVFEYVRNDGEAVLFSYDLNDDAFDLDYAITIKGFEGKVSPKNVTFNWDVAYRKTERLFSEQRRVSTVCYNYKDEGFSYLSEMADDDEEAEDEIEWVSFKQSYFSSFIHPEKAFDKSGSSFKVKNYGDNHKRSWTNLKDFSTTLNLNLNDVENETVHMNWFFGPNDFKTLKSYDAGYDNVLNYGWGLFRWINLYAVQPLFNLLSGTGMAIGLTILLLTLVIKFALMPIQWKMYTSSAKMRILKPEIDELNKKYPEKEDAMKKQMEMMTLYRESGASPLSGCVPMLIQMPILLAVFRFFPSTFSLRQKSFLWAEDLSSYDSIYTFDFHIPFYGDHISLFTLLMAGTTLVYTFINSSNMQTPQQPGMPNMKVIMYFFPIMMIFFFNNYSSGLSYYYFISTLISILIMIMIKKFFVDEEKLKLKMANRKEAASASPKKKGKSKFQERLEQMQKAQQEQLKNKKK